jgi:hypothetical protein
MILKDLVSVRNIDSTGISTLCKTVHVDNSSSNPIITLDGNTGVTSSPLVQSNRVTVGTAVTISSNGFTSGGITVSGIVTANSYVGSGASLTGLTGASAATYGSATQSPQILSLIQLEELLLLVILVFSGARWRREHHRRNGTQSLSS